MAESEETHPTKALHVPRAQSQASRTRTIPWLVAAIVAALGTGARATTTDARAAGASQEQPAPTTLQPAAAVEVNFSVLAAQDALNPRSPDLQPRSIHRPLSPLEAEAPGRAVDPSLAERSASTAQGGPVPQIPSPAPSTTFLGLEDSGTLIPPDTTGAVGRTHVMTTLNDRYRVHDRSGVTLSTLSAGQFWAATGAVGVFDPRTVYDPYNDRWIAAAVAGAFQPSSSILIGVSLTGDPTGAWRLVRYDADTTDQVWADFPTLGFNKNWIVVTLNMFRSYEFVRSEVYVIDYPRARATDFAGSRFATTESFTLQPAVTYSPTENTLYLFAHRESAAATYNMHTVTGTPASPALSAATLRTNPLGAWSPPGFEVLPQAGASRRIDAGDARITSNAVFRNGSIWFAQTIGLPAGATSSAQIQRTAVQWVQADRSGTALQSGRIVDPTATPTNGRFWYAYPSIAVNAANDVVVGFSRFSSGTFASAAYAYRATGDAPGSMRDPVVYKAGEATYVKTYDTAYNRWGDYSATVVDPLNDTDFWTLQEYARPEVPGIFPSRWSTWWARMAVVIDTDGDGLPDPWETQFGLDPLSLTGANGAAGDPDADGLTNLEEYQQGRHPRGFFKRYFAEGATGAFFDLVFALANTDAAATARVNLFFLLNTGATSNYPVSIGPSTRATVNAETAVAALAIAEFSTVVESDVPVVADRTMKWDATGYGAHSETSIAEPATRWYLAEGATHSGFDLFYLLQNPSLTAATVTINYLLDGVPPIVQTVTVAPNSRQSIWVDTIPQLSSANVSAVIDSSLPIIVERAMYLNLPGQPLGAGHESAGLTAPATNWFLAEGATGSFFDTFILIANPNATPATITADYLLDNGTRLSKAHFVPANSRYNIYVDTDLPQLANVAVSTAITSNVPVIVERAMWWPGPTAATWTEAHNSPGATSTGIKWALAEGEVAPGVETYILIANTSSFAGSARVTLLYENGSTELITIPLAASSRTNVDVRVLFPAASGRRFASVIESLGPTPAQIVVERAMYSNAGGVVWAAGTSALATKLQ